MLRLWPNGNKGASQPVLARSLKSLRKLKAPNASQCVCERGASSMSSWPSGTLWTTPPARGGISLARTTACRWGSPRRRCSASTASSLARRGPYHRHLSLWPVAPHRGGTGRKATVGRTDAGHHQRSRLSPGRTSGEREAAFWEYETQYKRSRPPGYNFTGGQRETLLSVPSPLLNTDWTKNPNWCIICPGLCQY